MLNIFKFRFSKDRPTGSAIAESCGIVDDNSNKIQENVAPLPVIALGAILYPRRSHSEFLCSLIQVKHIWENNECTEKQTDWKSCRTENSFKPTTLKLIALHKSFEHNETFNSFLDGMQCSRHGRYDNFSSIRRVQFKKLRKSKRKFPFHWQQLSATSATPTFTIATI